jgi:hypothetical protein
MTFSSDQDLSFSDRNITMTWSVVELEIIGPPEMTPEQLVSYICLSNGLFAIAMSPHLKNLKLSACPLDFFHQDTVFMIMPVQYRKCRTYTYL